MSLFSSSVRAFIGYSRVLRATKLPKPTPLVSVQHILALPWASSRHTRAGVTDSMDAAQSNETPSHTLRREEGDEFLTERLPRLLKTVYKSYTDKERLVCLWTIGQLVDS